MSRRSCGLAALLLLTCALQQAVYAAAPNPAVSMYEPAEPDSTSVRLEVERDKLLENGNPGFVLYVTGWTAEAEFSISAIDRAGGIVWIVPVEKHLNAPLEGTFSFSIPYNLRGLHPGSWIFLVAGQPGTHRFDMVIPAVEPPTETNSNWRIDYDAAVEFDKTVVEKGNAEQ